jgi:ATP-dependent Lon protease
VLPIGGLKEKSVAAHRNKISEVIIPFGNARDVDDLPEEVRASVRFHPVKTMDEVLTIALRGDVLQLGAKRAARRAAAREQLQPDASPAPDQIQPGLTH